MKPSFRTAALAAGLLAAVASWAGDDCVSPASTHCTVLISATRFADAGADIPANISVITHEDILNTPATSVPDLLKAIAGVEVRPLYGAMGIDATVDLRGFGDTAVDNTLVLLDGQRLNPIDSGNISWSTITLSSIQRIEIIRGTGAVLYGDRAGGGVINIVTDRAHSDSVSAQVTGGSYGYRSADAQASGVAKSDTLQAVAHVADADGWRRNSGSDQQSASLRAGHGFAAGEVFSDLSVYKDSNGLPGALLTADYLSDPRNARTPSDSQHREGYRLRPGASIALSRSLSLDAEVSLEHENYESRNVSFASVFDRHRTMIAATPRLRWQPPLGVRRNEVVAGIDYYRGQVDASLISDPSVIPQLARQASVAVYAQDLAELSEHWVLSLGVREQQVSQHVRQSAYVGAAGAGTGLVSGLDGAAARSRAAFDAGLVYRADGWRAFGKFASVYRFANTDELFGFDPFTGNPVFAGDLRPQHGRIVELGTGFTHGPTSARLSVFQLELNDEIDFDGNSYANVNLAPTQRRGIEAELDTAIFSRLRLHAAYAFIDASLHDGPDAGKQIPLVARNKAALQLVAGLDRLGTYSVDLTAVGERRYSGDFANSLGTLAGYLTLDLQARWAFARWTLQARVINALDRRYAPFAGYSTFLADHYFYPADARSLFLSLGYELR